jgi:DNA replication protein DnaC
MNTTATEKQLQQLRLKAMAKHYAYVLNLPIHQQPEAHQLIGELADQEMYYRQNRKTELLLKASKLRLRSHVNQVTYELERNLKEQNFLQLVQGDYIIKAENLLITGATGCGKTYIACALGNQACLQGHSVLYYNMNKLADKIVLSKLDGSYNKLYKQLVTTKLLLLDDFGLVPMTYETKLTLLQIIEERYELKATMIIAQIPIAKWYDYIEEPTIADAILDRLTAKAHRIELKGQSKRMKIN